MQKRNSVAYFQNNLLKDFFIEEGINNFQKLNGYLINGKKIQNLDEKYLDTGKN